MKLKTEWAIRKYTADVQKFRSHVSMSKSHIMPSSLRLARLGQTNKTNNKKVLLFRAEQRTKIWVESRMLMTNYSSISIVPITSGTDVKLKELFILGLFFALLFYSIISFMKIWNKTYRDVGAFYHFEQPRKNDSQRRASSIKGPSQSE